jgi:acyl-CoA dehydrogenase
VAWDFQTDADFQTQLDWMRAFIDDELIPLEPSWPSCRATNGRS